MFDKCVKLRFALNEKFNIIWFNIMKNIDNLLQCRHNDWIRKALILALKRVYLILKSFKEQNNILFLNFKCLITQFFWLYNN